MRFGGIRALEGFSLEAHPGRITAVIGPNGAGKTTALNCISGIYQPQQGQVWLMGREVTGLRPWELAAMGLVRTFQNIQVFGQMSVLENVMVGAHTRARYTLMGAALRLGGVRRQEKELEARAREALEFVGLGEVVTQRAHELPYGQRKRLELARAIAAGPKVVLLDEPAAGLNPAETHEMGKLVVELAGRGMAVVLVEHDMALVMRISHEVIVLCEGQTIAVGSPAQVQSDPEVVRVYLGGGEEFGLCA